MTIKTANVWPVNELGEIVAQAGSGTANVTGFISQDQIPSDPATNKVPIKINVPASDVLAEPITGFVSGSGTVAATDTVLQGVNKLDGNFNTRSEQLLYVKRGANMQLTTDQAFTKVFSGTKYRITDITASRVTGAASVTCAGGIYDQAAKAGNTAVAATQSWVTLAAGTIVVATLDTAASTVLLGSPLILSLTTGSTAACTADIFVYGYPLD